MNSPAANSPFARIQPATWAFAAVFVVLALLRWLHFGPDIDLPHDWRQFDTAQYIRSMAEGPMDPFHPSVAWMGGHKTLILEFPLPEMLTALLYRAFGPDILWARLLTWLFFCGGSYYLYRILLRVGDPGLAQLATCIYMVLPLGYYYSRAVHIDFVAVFFAHGMVHHLLRSLDAPRARMHLVLAGLLAALGFLVKAPYLFYLLLPCCVYLWRQGRLRSGLLPWVAALSPAVVLFLLWNWHTRRVNAAAPDWDFIPYYRKFDDMWNWYFGIVELRWMSMLWEVILGRIRYVVAGGFPGVYLALAGLAVLAWRRFGANFMRWWLLGAVVYLLIFFPLNFNHDYYQIPFLVPVAYFIALSVEALAQELGKLGAAYRWGVHGIAVMLLFLNTWRLTHQMGLSEDEAVYFSNYFQVDHGHRDFGDWVDKHTPAGALIVASSPDLAWQAPHLLYLSHRYGWSIPHQALRVPLLQQLHGHGASFLALYHSERLRPGALDSIQNQFPVLDSTTTADKGNPAGCLLLRLDPE